MTEEKTMKIAIVTDSTAYLTPDEITANNIRVVPIPVIFGDQVYEEGVNITNEEFYTKLATSKDFPSTSQPPIGQLMETYEQLAAEGYEAVISIHLSSSISGLINTVHQLADQMADTIKIVPFDSHLTIRMMGELALEGTRLVAAGDDLDTVVAKLSQFRDTFNNLFVVDDLQNLVRGGRLSNAQAFVGSVLKIKPLLTMHTENYAIEAFEKVRSMKKAKARVEELFDQDLATLDYPVRAFVIHANAEEAGEAWRESLAEKYPDVDFALSYFGPVIGTHLGAGALAIVWMQDTTKQPLG